MDLCTNEIMYSKNTTEALELNSIFYWLDDELPKVMSFTDSKVDYAELILNCCTLIYKTPLIHTICSQIKNNPCPTVQIIVTVHT